MPDTSRPIQYDSLTKREKQEAISFEDLDAYVQEHLVPDGGLLGQFLKRGAGGVLEWGDTTVPNFTVGNVTTSYDINDVDVNISGVSPNLIMDFVLPVGVGATPNIDVWPLINMLASGQQGTAFMGGSPLNRTLYLSLPLAPTPNFYVNNVQAGANFFDAQVSLVNGGSSNVGFNFTLPRGLQGIAGITPQLGVNSIVTPLPVGSQGQATISGTPENPILNLALPLSPVPEFGIGSISTIAYGSPATASISGSPAYPLLNLALPQGAPGQAPNLQIGTVQAGTNPSDAQASITGTQLNPLLNLTLPRGLTGATPNISINPNVTPLPVGSQGTASIGGTPENPIITLSLPLSPVPSFTAQANMLAYGQPATANISGTPANPLLTIGVPQGQPGATPQIAVNPVVTPLPAGSQGEATMTGTALNPYLSLSLPLSPVAVFTAQANTLAPGQPATASISGTPANPLLTIGVPQGQIGATPNLTIGTVNTLAPGQPASANFTGTQAAPILNLNLPQGMTGTGGVTVNGQLYTNLVLDGLGTQGGIVADPTGLPPGSVRFLGSHRLLNTIASMEAQPLVQNPGDATSHVIKQIRGMLPIVTIDAGSEIRIGMDNASLFPVGVPGDTLYYDINSDLAINPNIRSFHTPSFKSTRLYGSLGTEFGVEVNSIYGVISSPSNSGFSVGQSLVAPTETVFTIFSDRLAFFQGSAGSGANQQSVPAAANDLPSAINLVNAMRQAGLNYGLYKFP